MKRYPRKQAADFLTEAGFPIKASYLEKLATVGGGPVYELWGRQAIYTADNLLAWAEGRLSAPRSSTSDAAA
jgi:hypothetical protein